MADAKAGGVFGWGLLQKAQQLAAQAVDTARPLADKVKDKASQIDTSKVREVVQQATSHAQDAIQQARTAAEPQLAQARTLVDKQTQNLSKVNAKSLLNPNSQFGVPLESLSEKGDDGMPLDKPRVPVVLERMLKRLEESAGDDYVVEGRPLFSLPPDHTAVRIMAKAIDTAPNSIIISQQEPHAVSSLLRQWLVELPEPLFTSNLYDSCIQASLEEDSTSAFRVIIAKLPPVQATTLRRFVPFLASLASKGKLDMATICLSFGPAMLRPKRREGALRGLMEDLPAIVHATEKIIGAASTLFPVSAEASGECGGQGETAVWGGASDFADGSV